MFWGGQERLFVGYAAGDDSEDEELDLGGDRWLNVDDRFGLVFRGRYDLPSPDELKKDVFEEEMA